MKRLQKHTPITTQDITPTHRLHPYISPTTTLVSLHSDSALLAGSEVHNQKGDEGDYAKEPLPNNSGKESSDMIWSE